MVKDAEKLPNKIKKLLEKGKIDDKDWEDDNKIENIIFNCINIENNIKKALEVDEKLKKFDEAKNCKINFSPKNEGELQNILEPIISLGKIDTILAKNEINKNIIVNEIEPNKYFDQEQNINLIEYQPIIQNNIIPLVEKEIIQPVVHKEIQPVTRKIIQPVIRTKIQTVITDQSKVRPGIIQSNVVAINIVPPQKVIQKK